jgi:hypothetical protein
VFFFLSFKVLFYGVSLFLFGRQRQEMEVKDPIAVAREVQKADRKIEG